MPLDAVQRHARVGESKEEQHRLNRRAERVFKARERGVVGRGRFFQEARIAAGVRHERHHRHQRERGVHAGEVQPGPAQHARPKQVRPERADPAPPQPQRQSRTNRHDAAAHHPAHHRGRIQYGDDR